MSTPARARRFPTLGRLVDDSFRRFQEMINDPKSCMPWEAAQQTARHVEDPIRTHARLQEENPFPPHELDYHTDHNEADNWHQLAQEGIANIISHEMDRYSTGARKALLDEYYGRRK